MTKKVQRIILFACILSYSYKAFAPSSDSFVIFENKPIEPYVNLIHAIGKVETNHDTLRYNPEENAVGYFQIRPIRVEDYNIRTGSHYRPEDMFDYKISEKVFLYYANKIGPYDLRQIAMNWNGSGPGTIFYWNMVKEYL